MNERYDEIERYLSGAMSAEELAAFSQKLTNDDELAEELAVMQMARESIGRQAETAAEIAELRDVMSKAASSTPSRQPIIKQLWSRPAGIGAAAAITVLLWVNWSQGDTLYRQYAAHPALALAQRSSEGQDSVIALEAAYQREDYGKAYELISAYASANGWNAELRLFAGICQLEQQQYSAAKEQFKLLYQGNSANQWAGAWYLSLTYLREAEAGDQAAFQQCEEVLQEIPIGTEYYERAERLLEALRERGG